MLLQAGAARERPIGHRCTFPKRLILQSLTAGAHDWLLTVEHHDTELRCRGGLWVAGTGPPGGAGRITRQ